MKQIIFLSAVLWLLSTAATAQTNTFPSTGAAGIGTTTPHASSLLEIRSTSKGLLISRMTRAQRDAIASPATGLLIYQTDNMPGFYYYGGKAWNAVTPRTSFWSLTGNAGTNPATHFVGTTDNVALSFRVNAQKAGFISPDPVLSNTALGYQSFNQLTTGRHNTAFGGNAMTYTSTGSNNTALGSYALSFNVSGSGNTALGDGALAVSNGQGNTATGYATLYNNYDGRWNTANGNGSLYANENGSNNTAMGHSSMQSNTSGWYNVADGDSSLFSNTAGSSNVAVGASALYSNTTGSSNIAIGVKALYRSQNNSNNIAIGDSAMLDYNDGTFADYMLAAGTKALMSNTYGFYNTALGGLSLSKNTTGACNTAVGFNALVSNKHGSNNTAVGCYANVSGEGFSNATAIGNGAVATASNQVMLGNTSVTSVRAAGSYVIYSDGRFKKNVQENVPGLAFINLLKPVTYHYDIQNLNKKIDAAADKRSTGEAGMVDAIAKKEKTQFTGFIAQEVEQAASKLHFDFSGVYKPQSDKDVYGLDYAGFVVPLVKAVQELSKLNNVQQEEINELKEMVKQLQQTRQSAVNKQHVAALTGAALMQNTPNPFANTTTLGYTLPQQYTNAKIIITDNKGTTIKTITLSGSGKGSVQVNASILPAGAYKYSLYINNTLIGTKQMLVLK